MEEYDCVVIDMSATGTAAEGVMMRRRRLIACQQLWIPE